METQYCETCGNRLDQEIDYQSSGPVPATAERNGKAMHAVWCVEQLVCHACLPPTVTVLREGTAYWSQQSWDAEAEPDEIVWTN